MLVALHPFAGYVAAIGPDGTTTTLLPANETVQNPAGFGFESSGTLWVASFENARFVPLDEAGPGATVVLADEPLDLAVDPAPIGSTCACKSARSRSTTRAARISMRASQPAAGTLSRVDAGGNATGIGTDFGPDGRLSATDYHNDRIRVVPDSGNAAAAIDQRPRVRRPTSM